MPVTGECIGMRESCEEVPYASKAEMLAADHARHLAFRCHDGASAEMMREIPWQLNSRRERKVDGRFPLCRFEEKRGE